MDKKTVIVTGGNAGLGYQCAKNVAASDPDYHVVLACRSPERAAVAVERMTGETGNSNISAMEIDLASLASVRSFSDRYRRSNLPPLFGIVCNAGISAGGAAGVPETEDGVEMIFGVNHLAHFLLTNLLLPEMGNDGRVVIVTSDLHNPPRLFPVSVSYTGGEAIAHGSAGMQQYCTSKLCNIYCAYEMARLLVDRPDSRITVNAFNPGAMTDTGFMRPAGNPFARAAVAVIGRVMSALVGKPSTASESGEMLASLITSPALAETTGKYFDRGEQTESSALSYDKANARELWESSLRMSGLGRADTLFG